MSGGESAQDGDTECGQSVVQDVADAPSAEGRVAGVAVEAEELAEGDAAQTLERPGADELGQCAVDLAEPGSSLVFEEENRPLQAGQAGSRLRADRTEVAAHQDARGCAVEIHFLNRL
ncbi:hypothetical protein OG773_42265 [Streptomyces sp. NBC_00140]|nr:hypothetical protein [Streptomyces sp. NBC_00140]MCX5335921.1 hypothetical protein [Streptomyces sp. NBC_00140]